MDEALFAQAVSTDEFSALDEVQAENRRLKQQVCVYLAVTWSCVD
jgi:hypothetical protein